MWTGAPGSLVTFLDWEDGAPGRVGHGQVLEMSFAIAPDSIGDWLGRALNAHVPVEGPERAFGAPVLRLRDPRIIVKLTGVPRDLATPTRLSGATLLSADPEATAAFAIRLGHRRGPRPRARSG